MFFNIFFKYAKMFSDDADILLWFVRYKVGLIFAKVARYTTMILDFGNNMFLVLYLEIAWFLSMHF